jgi:hypothetical protein
MARMTKAQARKRLDEAGGKVANVLRSSFKLGLTDATDRKLLTIMSDLKKIANKLK